jgi:hypothetical protein
MSHVSKAKPTEEPPAPTNEPSVSDKGRQWRELQVVELLEVFQLHPPIGKTAKDGQMKSGGAKAAIWAPIAAELNKRLPEVNKLIVSKKPEDEGKLKQSVSADECKTKYDAMQKEYRRTCTCALSSLHQYAFV